MSTSKPSFPSRPSGTLYLVPLPIGNPQDITLRAKEVLSTVPIVAAEDTRTYRELAHTLKLPIPQVLAHHDHNEEESSQGILKFLLEGKDVALTTDAGTPNISDPGFVLVRICFENQIRIIPLPGASSVTTALSACPLGGTRFIFEGFLPSASGQRQTFLKSLQGRDCKTIAFESPHRLMNHLHEARDILGDIEIFIAREMTKSFEDYRLARLSEHILHFEKNPPKGELVLIYPALEKAPLSKEMLQDQIKGLLDEGRTSKEILDLLKTPSGLNRQDLYDLIQALKNQ